MIAVEEVNGRTAMRRFVELPHALHHHDPRWAAPVMAYERWRLDPHRNPFFEAGDARYLLARRRGVVAGRITAHVRAPGDEGWFGFFDVVDDAAVAGALVDAAQRWLDEQGCRSMTGPVSFTLDDEAGVLVAGHDARGMTGRSWQPAWCASHLAGAGLEPAGDRSTWRLDATVDGSAPPASGGELPPHAGRYADPRLVLDGIAAVPDVSGALGVTGLRSALASARQLREARWHQCCVVRLTAPPEDAVPRLLRAAGAAGYGSVVAPWSGGLDAPPETVHRLFRREW